MNNSRRKFLEKGSAVAVAAGVGVASAKIAMASSANNNEGTRPLLDAFIENQAKINGSFYAVNDLMLEVLSRVIHHVPGINVAATMAKLEEAEGYLGPVPDRDPPKCILPDGFDPYK